MGKEKLLKMLKNAEEFGKPLSAGFGKTTVIDTAEQAAKFSNSSKSGVNMSAMVNDLKDHPRLIEHLLTAEPEVKNGIIQDLGKTQLAAQQMEMQGASKADVAAFKNSKYLEASPTATKSELDELFKGKAQARMIYDNASEAQQKQMVQYLKKNGAAAAVVGAAPTDFGQETLNSAKNLIAPIKDSYDWYKEHVQQPMADAVANQLDFGKQATGQSNPMVHSFANAVVDPVNFIPGAPGLAAGAASMALDAMPSNNHQPIVDDANSFMQALKKD